MKENERLFFESFFKREMNVWLVECLVIWGVKFSGVYIGVLGGETVTYVLV